jgi:hypothetical protein
MEIPFASTALMPRSSLERTFSRNRVDNQAGNLSGWF